VLFHVNEPVGHAYPGKSPMIPAEIWDLVRRFSGNKIVLAHFGGGIFFYGLLKKEAKEVFQNTWFDTAAAPYVYSSGIYSTACEIVGPEKILFGSDYPLIAPKRYFEDMRAAGLSADAVSKICGKSAQALLCRD
jgi:predicted TIM-barrel fold metal-dependent hydrolase